MKRLFTSTLVALTVLAASAVPAKPGVWKNIRLQNGTVIKAELCGDEYAHCWRDANGNLYRQSERMTDIYEYVTVEQMNQARKASIDRQQPSVPLYATAKQNDSGFGPTTIYSGTQKCLVILVDFPDCPFEEGHDLELYKRIINEPGYTSDEGYVASVRDFYRDQSYGTFDIDFTVAGIYTMPNGYAYYGGDNGGQDRRCQEMVKEAFRQANADVDYKDFDWDGDGVVELVFIVYAGRGQADGGADDTIWPHKSAVNYQHYDGVYVSTYACACELQRGGINAADPEHDNIPLLDGIGTICHEFSHCMGLPDAYDAQYSGYEGMGYWSIMAAGCYLGNSFRPCGYTAYEKMYCGWVDPVILSDTTVVDNMPAIGAEPVAYAIMNDATDNEYYLLENRQQEGWDASLYGNGLLITHIDYDDYIWAWNLVNSDYDYYGIKNDHQRYTFVPADGVQAQTSYAQIAGDTYPTASNNVFSNDSWPYSMVYNPTADGSSVINMAVRDIKRQSAGKVSFVYEPREAPKDPDAPENAIFYESFNQCRGYGGTNGIFTGGDGEFIADNDGWKTNTINFYGASRCARFGTDNKKSGSATTPAISLGEDVHCYYLDFMAAPYDGDGKKMVVDIENGTGELSESVLDMTGGQWNNYRIKLTAGGDVRIRFRATKRFFLDEVAVIPAPEEENAITSVSDGKTHNSTRFNINGQYADGQNDGLIIENGKVVFIKK